MPSVKIVNKRHILRTSSTNLLVTWEPL